MKTWLRESLGKAVYEAEPNDIPWEYLIDKEQYCKQGEAAVRQFLSHVMPTIGALLNGISGAKQLLIDLVDGQD